MCPNPDCGELFDAPGDVLGGGETVCPACGGKVPVTGQVDEQGRRQVQAMTTEPADLPSTTSIRLSDDDDADSLPVLDLTPATEDAPKERSARREGSKRPGVSPPTSLSTKPKPRAVAVSLDTDDMPAPRKTVKKLDADDATTEITGAIPVLDDEIVIKDLAETAGHEVAGKGDESILDRPLAGWIILGLAVLGLLGGAALAWLFSPDHAWLSLYAGAGAGWVLGFSLGFLLVLSADRSESDAIRCTACGRNNPHESETCGWCGTVLPSMNLGPMALGCLKALRYAGGNKGGLVWMGILSMPACVAICGWAMLPDMAPAIAEYQWVAAIVAVVVGLGYAAYVLEFVLDGVAQSAAGRDTAPPVPVVGMRLFGVAVAAMVLPVLYVLPIVTLPLLPLAMAIMSRRLSGVVRMDLALASARRRLKDVVVLWLLVLLYVAGGALSALGGLVLHLLAAAVPTIPGPTQFVVQIGLASLVTAVAMPFVILFALAIARCVGLFVRYGE